MNHNISSFQLSMAMDCAQLSELAYNKFEEDRALLEEPLADKGYELVEIFFNKETDTQAFIAKKGGYAFVVFRGTEMNLMDILTDLKASLDEKYGGHEGFFAGYHSIRDELRVELGKLGDMPLIFSGHSLGGALAKAALLTEKDMTNILAAYTYGSPPMCTKEVCETLNIPVHLVVNQSDIVPRVMVVGVLFIKPLVWALKKAFGVFSISKQKKEDIIRLFNLMSELRSDLKKYEHFPDIQWMDGSGRLTKLKNHFESVSIFIQLAFKDWEKTFVDHTISSYIKILNLKS